MSDEVREVVAQWVARAEVDWRSAQALASQEPPLPESVCFHCQQYVEKLLKALLTLHGVEAPRTHDLRRLVELASELVPGLAALCDEADLLSEHAVATRYPEDWRPVEPAEAHRMMALAERFADILLPELRQEPP